MQSWRSDYHRGAPKSILGRLSGALAHFVCRGGYRGGTEVSAVARRGGAVVLTTWKSSARMSEVKVVESHGLGAAEARRRIASFEEMMAKYGVKADWSGNQATLKGMAAKGSIEVTDTAATVIVKLGMMAKAAGIDTKKLEGSIRKRLRAAFDGTA